MELRSIEDRIAAEMALYRGARAEATARVRAAITEPCAHRTAVLIAECRLWERASVSHLRRADALMNSAAAGVAA